MIDPEDCLHPLAEREMKEVTLRGERIKLEVCSQCGLRLLSPADSERRLSRAGRMGKAGMSPQDLVLSLLGIQPDRPVYTRVVLMKEAFLVDKELSATIDLPIESLRWIPHRFGPYSRVVDEAVDRLETEELLVVERDSQGQKQIIGLSPKGRDRAQEILGGLEDRQRQALDRKRKAWDRLGYNGILQKVYREYPAYKKKSEIADRVAPKRRWT